MAKQSERVGARRKLREFFEQNLNRVVTSMELREAAGLQVSEWARRVRELRNEEGMQILTHHDREGLKPNEYILVSLERKRVTARGLSADLRKKIFERDGYTCQICGAGPGDDAPCEPGKSVRLQVDHVVPISDGGTDDGNNLRTTCVYFNKEKSNIHKPASAQSISALSIIRRQPRSVQLEVYRFLASKFQDKF